MLWTPTPYTVVGVVAAVTSGGVAAVAVRHDSKPYAETFVALMIALAAWSLVYGVQLGFTESTFQLVWQRSALAVGGTIPTLWFVFAVQYAGVDEWLTSRRLRLLAAEPAAFALLTLTNHLHG
ncbi:MAG: histidine kinase N-terminal 7TM domain-containing protein, partial [Halobaculum sp.]